MADIKSKEDRSKNMAAIRGKDTKPELIVRRFLHSLGFRYRLRRKDLPGKPDITLPKFKTVVFVHGCFWHQHKGCRYAVMPKDNAEFWRKKLGGNVLRDRNNIKKLSQKGWNVITVWECELKKRDSLEKLATKIRSVKL